MHWENVDEETFVCFWQYAYTGSYDIPREEPKTTQEVTEEGAEEGEVEEGSEYASENLDEVDEVRPHEETNDGSTSPAAEDRPEQPSNRGKLWELFTALRSTGGHDDEVESEQENEGYDFDASDLLCHARVYVFADCYGIFDLMELSYNCIHRILSNLDLRTETLADIIALVHYCYETLAPPDLRSSLCSILRAILKNSGLTSSSSI